MTVGQYMQKFEKDSVSKYIDEVYCRLANGHLVKYEGQKRFTDRVIGAESLQIQNKTDTVKLILELTDKRRHPKKKSK